MLVHECGHILAAVCTGGTVTRLEWPLWGFSRTDVSPNPHPLPVAWAGPLFGALTPALLSLALRMMPAAFRRGGNLLRLLSAGQRRLPERRFARPHRRHRRYPQTRRPCGRSGPPDCPSRRRGWRQWHALGPKFGIARVGKTERLRPRRWAPACSWGVSFGRYSGHHDRIPDQTPVDPYRF